VVVVGCGAQSEEERVVERVKAAQQAYLDKDGEALCEFYTGRMRREVAATGVILGAKNCADVAQRVFDDAGPEDFEELQESQEALIPEDVKLRGSRATVSFVSGNEQPVRKVRDEWYIDGPSAKPKK
jgi:hypothetical protein